MANGLAQIPLIGGFFDNTGDQILQQEQKNQSLYGGLNTPTFNPYVPNQYYQAGVLDPTMATAETAQQDPALQKMQMSNLQRMAGLADTGLSNVDQAGYENARSIGNQVLHGGTEAALQNAQSRGQAGTGMEFGMREMAAQQGAQNAQSAALQQASDSAKMRALYTQAFGGAAGGLSAQNFNQNATNAGILNNFNMANTQAKNQAQQYNVGVAQSNANQNVGQKNYAQQYGNQMTQQQYEDQLQKVSGQAGANKGVADAYAAQGAADASNRNSLTQAGIGLAGAGMSANATNNMADAYNNRTNQMYQQ